MLCCWFLILRQVLDQIPFTPMNNDNKDSTWFISRLNWILYWQKKVKVLKQKVNAEISVEILLLNNNFVLHGRLFLFVWFLVFFTQTKTIMYNTNCKIHEKTFNSARERFLSLTNLSKNYRCRRCLRRRLLRFPYCSTSPHRPNPRSCCGCIACLLRFLPKTLRLLLPWDGCVGCTRRPLRPRFWLAFFLASWVMQHQLIGYKPFLNIPPENRCCLVLKKCVCQYSVASP